MVKVRKVLSLTLAISMMSTLLAGCSGKLGTDATKYPLQNALTQQEVLDYYKESLAYDTVITRSVEEHVSNYEMKPVTDETMQNLVTSAMNTSENYLKQTEFKEDASNTKYMTESLFTYIKGTLNDKVLSNRTVGDINQALGYYFVDVTYDISPSQIGTFTDLASLIGLDGAFKWSEYKQEDLVNTDYLTAAAQKLEEYYETNNVNLKVSYDTNTNKLAIGTAEELKNQSTETPVVTTPVAEETVDTAPAEEVTDSVAPEKGEAAPNVETADGSGEGTVVTPEPGNDIIFEETPLEEQTSNLVVPAINTARAPRIDVKAFHEIVGYERRSYIPKLSMVYTIANTNGTLSGPGIYPCGDGGLKIFGVDRSQITGKLTMRYVFKSSLTSPYDLSISNIYITNYEIYSGGDPDNSSLIPEFLNQTFENLIEESDRAISNCDITALSNGDIYTDLGQAVLTGYIDQGTNVLRQMSTLRRIISRDITNNAYLVEVETYRQEGAKSADVYGSYKDKVYMVIQQSEEKFVITDYMVMSRQLIEVPDINPDSAVSKRIVALGLAGDVSDTVKTNVTDLINSLYYASTNRKLRGPWTDSNGNTVDRGMYDCFNSNVEMVSSAELEEMNAYIRNYLLKYGTTVKSTMAGSVTEWLGGAANQVEFTTEEVITYQGRNDGVYMQCYYLASCIEDTWVIDEITVLDVEELSGEALQAAVSRIG